MNENIIPEGITPENIAILKIGKIFNTIKIYRILEHAKTHIKEELKNEQNISTK